MQNAGQYSGGRARRAGWDCTFSAPKSVSVLFAASDEQTKQVILAAHHQAVETVLGRLEEMASKTRAGHNGCQVLEAKGMTFARFDHFTSREDDMQIHTHAVCVNLTQAVLDGKFRALDGSGLFSKGRVLELGAFYRDVLKQELARELSLSFRAVNGKGRRVWEIEGIPQSLLDEKSKRSQQILAVGYETSAQARVIALKTRKPKLEDRMSRTELFASWKRELEWEYGDILNLERLQSFREREPERGAPETVHDKSKITPKLHEPSLETESHKHLQKLPDSAFAAPRVQITALDEAKRLVRGIAAKAKDISAPHPSSIHMWPELLRHGLDKDQRAKVRELVRGKGTTHLFKSFDDNSLHALSDTFTNAGMRFFTIALTKGRAKNLKEHGISNAVTLASALTILRPKPLLEEAKRNLSLQGLKSALWWPAGKIKHNLSLEGLKSSLRWSPNSLLPQITNRTILPVVMNRSPWLNPKSVLFVETDGIQNKNELLELRTLAEKAGARLIFSGETVVPRTDREDRERWGRSPSHRREEDRKRLEREQLMSTKSGLEQTHSL